MDVLWLSRLQFALTIMFHYIFPPLTIGMGVVMVWLEGRFLVTRDALYETAARFWTRIFALNFAIGVATGIVQEFQFGMNWSTYSRFVGNVFGAPLAIEGLAAFFLESVFLGLWVFGWNVLPRRLHLAMIWLAAAGSWLSAYFILVANSWMQHPVGYEVSGGQAVLKDVGALLGNNFAVRAFEHTMLVGLTTASMLVFGVACWHLLKGRNVELFKRAAALALIVAVPVTAVNQLVGSGFGIVTTENQPMKIASAEALWNTEQPASFSLFQVGGFSQSDPEPSFSIAIPRLLSFLATGSFDGSVEGMNQVEQRYRRQYGPGDYLPPVEVDYWSMRVMAYVGALMFLIAAIGAWLYRRGALERSRRFLWAAVGGIALPYVAATAGWVLTEMGRQPWIVQGLLRTAQANSPAVDGTTIAISLAVFALLYGALAVLDFVLMRRYARLDPPPPPEAPAAPAAAPAAGY
jgi:cytochrome d ubiquinol oxidase subunit I